MMAPFINHSTYDSTSKRVLSQVRLLADTGQFFLNHGGTFGNQDGMITQSLLAERH